jgi:hypothetical protein
VDLGSIQKWPDKGVEEAEVDAIEAFEEDVR